MSYDSAIAVLTKLNKFIFERFDVSKSYHTTEDQLNEDKANIRLIVIDTYNQILFLLITHGLTNPRRLHHLREFRSKIILHMYARARRIRLRINGTADRLVSS